MIRYSDIIKLGKGVKSAKDDPKKVKRLYEEMLEICLVNIVENPISDGHSRGVAKELLLARENAGLVKSKDAIKAIKQIKIYRTPDDEKSTKKKMKKGVKKNGKSKAV